MLTREERQPERSVCPSRVVETERKEKGGKQPPDVSRIRESRKKGRSWDKKRAIVEVEKV